MVRSLGCSAVMLLAACGPSSIELGGGKGGRDTAADTGIDHDSGDTGSGDTGSTDTGDSGGDIGEPAACLAHGFVVGESAHLAYGASLDAYDATAGAYGGANIGEGSLAVNSHADCALTSGAAVRGELLVGGDPSAAFCEEWGATTSGGVHQLAAEAELADVSAPSAVPDSEGEFSLAWEETHALEGLHHYEDFVLGYGSTLTISAPAVLVVDELRVEGATVKLDPGATLDLFVREAAGFSWGTAFNTGGSPAAVRIVLLGEDPLTLVNGATLTGQLLAPRSDVEIGGTFQGGASAASFEAAWGAALHLDESLLCP